MTAEGVGPFGNFLGRKIYTLPLGKKGSLLLTNHAFATVIPANFTVLDLFVDDKDFRS